MRKVLSTLLAVTIILANVTFAYADTTYTVQRGDTLAKIANKFGVTYQEIASANSLKNVNSLKVGQVLVIPGKSEAGSAYESIRGTDLVIATTTSTNDTGLLDVLVPAFDKKYGTTSKWVSVGSGEAMGMGKRGDADVLLVHSRAAEDTFIADGNGINRKDVMYNFYYIIGPSSDPAEIQGEKLAKDAFSKINDSKSVFLSRADKSGTHSKELTIWKQADLSPSGDKDTWYMETGMGMLDLLNMASELNGYTLADSGTWGSAQDKLSNLTIMVEGDPVLFNPYGVITVNPEKYPNLNTKAAEAFTDFITSAEGQDIIGNYVKNGQKLFIPDAK